ncbi:hypothetical protein SJ05684_c08580 [Sinorhizobium sojae CCBAU 05684]|uniref:Uncharacterized protein n=1 Tax=Sinorhizobium sojae CCBAU 05684 TaxID=716928 RepID=A0A249P8R8_9HYPH|nr:hypothetical protein SJ05684_c08580 [Sinorhizobium sojae CCBAU 05684]
MCKHRLEAPLKGGCSFIFLARRGQYPLCGLRHFHLPGRTNFKA